ncbi:MAG TPA: histidine kinase N-terminal 7TM domain-containing protein [Cyclobacteriaceae bacterium]|nr:histidine kinase N-terminal 7TM domain-containing protein [Cyclobacteriaceae bacterium]
MFFFKTILLISSIALAFLAVYALRFRQSRGSFIFSALLFAGFFYSFGYAFELGAKTVEIKIFWLHIQYLGIPALPTLWLIFSLQMTGKKNWLNPGLIILLIGISLSTIVVEHTNSYHHWFFENIDSVATGNYYVTVIREGPWYWFHIIYSNIAIAVGSLLFLQMYLQSSMLYRKQALFMLTGSVVPWAGHLLYILKLSPDRLDTGPVFMTASGILFSWGMYRYRLLDIIPVAAEQVLESMQEGVVILDREYRIIHFNPSVRKISGQFTEGALGRSIIQDFSELSKILNQVITGTGDITRITIPGDPMKRTFHVRVSPVIDGSKKLQGWTLIFNDITELQKIEEALRESKKNLESLNAAKDKFFRIISHDLKNPFQHLQGLTDILMRELPNMKQDELTRLIGMIHASATLGNKLLENLLIWVNSQTNKIDFVPEKLNIPEMINFSAGFCRGLAESKGIKLIAESEAGLHIMGDRNMIDLVLRNLITNAIKFTHQGGMVSVTARMNHPNVIISVIDDGTGIAREYLDNLFKIEKMHSTSGTQNEKGTGLGLILCKEFVEKNHGTIKVTSEPRKGSEFVLSFPSFDAPRC